MEFRRVLFRSASVRTLRGLPDRLPQSLAHTSARTSVVVGDLSPARTNSSETALARSVMRPSGSPITNRWPPVSSTTPGSGQIGRGSGRERGGRNVYFWGVPVYYKKKKKS